MAEKIDWRETQAAAKVAARAAAREDAVDRVRYGVAGLALHKMWLRGLSAFSKAGS